ncbi:hypothetical protein P7C70_g9060, partial [Phenoliferia sp. Uapishka_3]
MPGVAGAAPPNKIGVAPAPPAEPKENGDPAVGWAGCAAEGVPNEKPPVLAGGARPAIELAAGVVPNGEGAEEAGAPPKRDVAEEGAAPPNRGAALVVGAANIGGGAPNEKVEVAGAG